MYSTKKEMFADYDRGAFGNKLRTWNQREWEECSYKGTVTIRYKGEGGGSQFTAYNVPEADVPTWIGQFFEAGADINCFAFNESAPDHRLLWQGEIQEVVGFGLTSRWSARKCKMRDAMNDPSCVYHFNHGGTQGLLRATLTPGSLEDIYALLDTHPGSCIELSVYAVPLGNIPGRNAVVWEVRNY